MIACCDEPTENLLANFDFMARLLFYFSLSL